MPLGPLQAAVMGIGAIISLVSLTGVLLPAQLLRAVRAAWQYRAALFVAVMTRLTIGVLLVLAAPVCRFPLTFAVLGWLAIIAALLLPLLGHARMDRLIAWWERRPLPAIRLWSLAGVAFGGFLLYGAG